ncbi:MAG TPA: family 78 glycoside hydrolase catalytic domain [Clostridiales bacterium]|nr:family 78 glycoside hydrolase catalytic domain [Clostridiales bacterium]
MKITHLMTNHLINPLGFLINEPTFSWITSETTGKYQKAARIQVALDDLFKTIVHDSGISDEISSLGYTARISLSPCTRYYWRVMVWADNEEAAISEPAWFETGKGEQPWKAEWITAPFGKEVHPFLCKEFQLPGKVKAARAYVTGLGLYELEINGQRVGDEYLAPFCNDYARWLQYQTYDITEYLREGKNGVGAILGNGWYKGRFGFHEHLAELFGEEFAFLCELDITLEDDTRIYVATDESWLCHPSAVVNSNIYDGEEYDANRELPDWFADGWDTSGFVNAQPASPNCGPMMERLSPPVKITKRCSPVQLLHTPAGEQVIDFGQVMTGWVEFRCYLPKGSKVTIQFGELLQEGNFYNENLRTAKQEFIYISDGEEKTVRPHFTFYGFRYAKITGMEKVDLKDFTACVIHSDLERAGRIKTSNDKVNRLFENALWSQMGNFVDVPTDCPQRDERMGWTGDAQVFAATASFNMYTPSFYSKFLYDMLLEQRVRGGAVPHVVPDVLQITIDRIGQGEDKQYGSCAWGDAATVIPWTLYLFYGDKTLLESQFENMTGWVDFIKRQDDTCNGGRRLWENGFHYADWLALDNPDKSSSFGGTDQYYVASAYYYYSAILTAKAAKVLGKEKEAQYYNNLADEVKKAIRGKYFKDGKLLEDTQTALVMALYMDFAPSELKPGLVSALKKKLEDNKIHLNTGFVGTPYLCPVLSQNGLEDYAYTLLLNEDYPSWLYEINMGATTIWERWNSVLPNGLVSDTGMNSMNHYAYGSIVEWMYRYMCGLNPVEEAPGFKKVTLKPQFDSRFDWVEGEYLSAAGLYRCSWKREGNEVGYHIEIPFDAQAELLLPGKNSCIIINNQITDLQGQPIYLEPGHYEIIVQI